MAKRYEVRVRNQGKYLVRDTVSGSRYYLSDQNRLRELYWEEQKKTGRMSSNVGTQLALYAVVLGDEKPSMRRGKELLGLPSLGMERIKRVSEAEKRRALRAYWPPKKVDDFMKGKDVNLRRIGGFREEYRRVHNSLVRGRKGGMKAAMEKMYPGLYDKLTRAPPKHEFDVDELGDRILERYYEGKLVNKSTLMNSSDPEEMKMGRQVQSLVRKEAKRNLNGRGMREASWTEEASKATRRRLPPSSIMLDRSLVKQNGNLSEKMTALLFKWGLFLGIDMSGFILEDEVIIGQNTPLSFVNGGAEPKFADLRIANQAIEVKTGKESLTDGKVDELVEIYGPGRSHWKDNGESLDSSLVVYFHPYDECRKAVRQLRDAGIFVMHYGQFHSLLHKVVQGMRRNFSTQIETVRPRIHSLENLLRLHEKISRQPQLLFNKANSTSKGSVYAETVDALIELVNGIRRDQRE